MTEKYDLVIVGAGSGGLVAAGFAAALGARVVVVDKERVGGDCTWTGCVPSKALIKAARVAHLARTAAAYGIGAGTPTANMPAVRDYVRGAIAEVYRHETPETLRGQGIEVVLAPARFQDAHTLLAGDRALNGQAFLLCTGAHPAIPALAGLDAVPYLTYEQLFDNDRLPDHLIVIGGGPVGLEMGQAYRRLGSAVTIVAPGLLRKEEPEVGAVLQTVFAREGLRLVAGRATAVRREGAAIVVTAGDQDVRGDRLLVATGRAPTVDGLALDKAGVAYSAGGIAVDRHLRTSAGHIYAAGDCTGGAQYTHYAGWQAFQAARNALLPGSSDGFSAAVPRVTFTAPEVASVGATEAAARAEFGAAVVVAQRPMDRVDRAVCENALDGFIKIVHKTDGRLLGATVVAERAGEAITEFVIALQREMKVSDLAGPMHPYPTFSTPIQQMAANIAVADLLGGLPGAVLRAFARAGR